MTGSALHSQHIPGKANMIGDSLSRDFHMNTANIEHAHTLLFHPQILAQPLKLYKTRIDITSWLQSLPESKTVEMVSHKQPIKSNLGTYLSGSNTQETVASKITGLMDSQSKTESSSSQVLQVLLGEINIAQHRYRDFYMAQYWAQSVTLEWNSGRF